MSSAVVRMSFFLAAFCLFCLQGGGNFNVPVYLKYFSDMLGGLNKAGVCIRV